MASNIRDGEATEQNNDIDPTIAKHLDIAIEAQDGPPADTNTAIAKEGEDNKADQTKQPDAGASSGSDATAQPKPVEKGKEEAKPAHGAKDLTLQDGTVIKGGSERRFYEQRNIAREQVKTLQEERAQIAQERDEFKNKYTQLEQTVQSLHGADPNLVSVGLKIVNDLQRDPQGTMQKLLAEVIAQGYTIEGIGAGIDTAAITRLIEERLPQNSGETEAQAVERITAEATAEANSFFSAHPDAKPHDELLARMLSDNPGLSLKSAYFQLKEAFAEKGFDWSQSLEANVKGLSGQTNNENSGNDQTNTNNGKPLPNGGNGQGTDVVVNRGNISLDTDDTGDIVREAMREAGMKI